MFFCLTLQSAGVFFSPLLYCKNQECLSYNEVPLWKDRMGENWINVNMAIRLPPSRINRANLSHCCTSVNHFVTLQTFICILLAMSKGEKANPELNQRSVCSVVCLPTTHWKLLVNTQTLLWGILEENIHLLHGNTQRCASNRSEIEKLTHADTLAASNIPPCF